MLFMNILFFLFDSRKESRRDTCIRSIKEKRFLDSISYALGFFPSRYRCQKITTSREQNELIIKKTISSLI